MVRALSFWFSLVFLGMAAPVAAENNNFPSAPPPPKKLEFLESKQDAQAAADEAARARYQRLLDKRIGKEPTPVINVRNNHTNEWIVLGDEKSGPEVDGRTFSEFLRCHFTQEPTQMDDRLVNLLYRAARKFQKNRIHVVSGFRAPKYNLILRKKGREVAKNSQHTMGNAVDFRIPGVPAQSLFRFVRSLRIGGAGVYRVSGFVHADTGPVRQWSGR